jgi:O-antigen/teichoic acid export membrane protein
VLINRYLGPSNKGIFALLQTFLSLALLFLGINFSYVNTFLLSSKKITPQNAVSHSLIFVLISTVLLLCLFVFFKNSLYYLLPEEIINNKNWVILIIISFFINQIIMIFQSVIKGLKEFIILNKITVFVTFINLLLIIICYYTKYFNDKVLLLFSLNIVLQLINIYFTLKYILKSSSFKFSSLFKFDLSILKKYIVLGYLAYLSNLFQFLNYKMDYWLIDYYVGIKQLGYYSLSSNLNQYLFIIPNIISGVIMPYVSSEDKGMDSYTRISRILFFVSLIISVLFFISSDFLIKILYGNEFLPAIRPFKILVLSFPFFSITTYYAGIIAGKGKIKINLIASLLGLFATVILGFNFIPKYGIIGASYTTFVSFLLTFLFVWYNIKKITRFKARDYFLIRKNDFQFILQLWKKKI